CSIFSIVV
ncbi:exodeoxyribonuclease V, gamma subunit, partial [Vibrio parahaemolyticus V-223/04]